MSEAQFALMILGVLFLGSNVFWAWHSHLLLNKLMSRNYQDFQNAEVKGVEAKKPAPKMFVPEGYVDDLGSVREMLV